MNDSVFGVGVILMVVLIISAFIFGFLPAAEKEAKEARACKVVGGVMVKTFDGDYTCITGQK
jgi:hypothetical protein